VPQILQESLAYPCGEILPNTKLRGAEATPHLPASKFTSAFRCVRKADGGRRKGLRVQLEDDDDKQAVMGLVTPRVDVPLECDRRTVDFRQAE